MSTWILLLGLLADSCSILHELSLLQDLAWPAFLHQAVETREVASKVLWSALAMMSTQEISSPISFLFPTPEAFPLCSLPGVLMSPFPQHY